MRQFAFSSQAVRYQRGAEFANCSRQFASSHNLHIEKGLQDAIEFVFCSRQFADARTNLGGYIKPPVRFAAFITTYLFAVPQRTQSRPGG